MQKYPNLARSRQPGNASVACGIPWKSNTTPNTHTVEDEISGRVPAVSAFGLTWSLSMEVLLQSSTIELLSSLELQLAETSSAGSPVSGFWPQGLKCLVFDF